MSLGITLQGKLLMDLDRFEHLEATLRDARRVGNRFCFEEADIQVFYRISELFSQLEYYRLRQLAVI